MTALDLAACRRGELAERLVPKALELACLVHGDGDALSDRPVPPQPPGG